MKSLRVWATLFVLIFGSAGANADRDIVYSARQYAPVGSGLTSHFQIYRINPDGTKRVQLTFGRDDCEFPVWSPDGKWILYMSIAYNADRGRDWIMTAEGRRQHALVSSKGEISEFSWLPEGHSLILSISKKDAKGKVRSDRWLYDVATGKESRYTLPETSEWSPDGKWLIYDGGVYDVRTKKKTPFGPSPEYTSYCWVDSTTIARFVTLGEGDKTQWTLSLLELNGAEKLKFDLKFSPVEDDNFSGSRNIRGLHPIRGRGDAITIADDQSGSNSRPKEAYHLVDLKTGATKILIQRAQFLIWSAKGDRFLSAPGRDLDNLGNRKDGRSVMVWAAPLELHDSDGKLIRKLTRGVVWVNGYDWR